MEGGQANTYATLVAGQKEAVAGIADLQDWRVFVSPWTKVSGVIGSGLLTGCTRLDDGGPGAK